MSVHGGTDKSVPLQEIELATDIAIAVSIKSSNMMQMIIH
jgi:hypothetical protein